MDIRTTGHEDTSACKGIGHGYTRLSASLGTHSYLCSSFYLTARYRFVGHFNLSTLVCMPNDDLSTHPKKRSKRSEKCIKFGTHGGESMTYSWGKHSFQYDCRLTHHIRKEGNEHSAKETETSDHHFTQFARIDEGLFSWNFTLRDRNGQEIASVERGFRGWGREASQIFISYGPMTITS
jgi:hypothetical protein